MQRKKTMTFLENPAHGSKRIRRRGSAGKSSARKGAAARKRRSGSNPAAGATRRSSSPSQAGSNMAKQQKHKRRARGNRPASASRSVARSNPPRAAKRRRGHRSNPFGIRRAGLVTFTKDAATGAVATLGGEIVARKVRNLAGQKPGTIIGSAIEAAAGLAAGMLASRLLSPSVGHHVAVGGILAPLRTAAQQAQLPLISDSLGDDGFLFGDSSAVELVSAYDEPVAGYVGGASDNGLGAYVQGMSVAS